MTIERSTTSEIKFASLTQTSQDSNTYASRKSVSPNRKNAREYDTSIGEWRNLR